MEKWKRKYTCTCVRTIAFTSPCTADGFTDSRTLRFALGRRLADMNFVDDDEVQEMCGQEASNIIEDGTGESHPDVPASPPTAAADPLELSEREYDLLDAGMCAWEYVHGQLTTERIPAHWNKWERFLDRTGSATLRVHVGSLAPVIHAAWMLAHSHDYDRDFDWDFVPRFLSLATDENCDLLANWREVAVQIANTVEGR